MKNNPIHVLMQPSGSNDYWMHRLLDGIQKEATSKKFALIPYSYASSGPIESISYDNQLVLLVGTTTTWLSGALDFVCLHGGIPIFVTSCVPDLPCAVSSVSFALEYTVRDCLDYMRQLGKNKTMLIGLNPISDADHKKAAIFQNYIHKNNISGHCLFCENASLEESIVGSLEEVLHNGTDSLICSNDTTAILSLKYLKKHDIAIGENFPVIGMGNSFLGSHTSPKLTTVDFDYFSLGEEAVRLFDFLQNNAHHAHVQMQIPASLLVRDSTGNVPYTPQNAMHHHAEKQLSNYFGGDLVGKLIMLENELQHCSEIDREIIFGTSDGETYSQLAERLFMSERSLKYRLSHILKRLHLKNKSELNTLVQEVLVLK